MTSSRFFINSAQPTSLHYHHHRLACTLLWLPQSISTIQSFASFATIPGTLVAPEYILKLSMDPNGLAFLHNGTIFYSDMLLSPIQSILGDINFQKTMLVSTDFNTLSGGRDHT